MNYFIVEIKAYMILEFFVSRKVFRIIYYPNKFVLKYLENITWFKMHSNIILQYTVVKPS